MKDIEINYIFNNSGLEMTQKNSGVVYLLREREFIKTKENIYKIGKTRDISNRMKQYPNDSEKISFFIS